MSQNDQGRIRQGIQTESSTSMVKKPHLKRDQSHRIGLDGLMLATTPKDQTNKVISKQQEN